MKIFNVKFAAILAISLIIASTGCISCSSKQPQESEATVSETKTFSPEVIKMSEFNWQEDKIFMPTVNGGDLSIDVVKATIPTDKQPLIVCVSSNKIFLRGRNFDEPLENLIVSNRRESHKIHWYKYDYCVEIIIKDPESYANFIKVLDHGEFDLTINENVVHVSAMGRGVEYAVINKLKK